MPILNFEYTDNLKIDSKIKSFLLEVHDILVQEIKTDLRTCRSSIRKISDYVIGDGNSKNAYILLQIQMLPGRSEDIKHKTGKILLDKIHHDFSNEIKEYETQVRVYLCETDKKHYYGLE